MAIHAIWQHTSTPVHLLNAEYAYSTYACVPLLQSTLDPWEWRLEQPSAHHPPTGPSARCCPSRLSPVALDAWHGHGPTRVSEWASGHAACVRSSVNSHAVQYNMGLVSCFYTQLLRLSIIQTYWSPVRGDCGKHVEMTCKKMVHSPFIYDAEATLNTPSCHYVRYSSCLSCWRDIRCDHVRMFFPICTW